MTMPKKFYYPAMWSYCVVIFATGYYGRDYQKRWDEDWTKSLPAHQTEYYIDQLQDNSSSTLKKIHQLIVQPKRVAQRKQDHQTVQLSALYLLDKGGQLHTLPERHQVRYWIRRINSDYEFAEYTKRRIRTDGTPIQHNGPDDWYRNLWEKQDLTNPIAEKQAMESGQFENVLRERWSLQWFYAADRAKFAQIIMEHFSHAVDVVPLNGDINRQARRRLELLHSVPLISWFVGYEPHAANVDPGDVGLAIVHQARALREWWSQNRNLTQDQREKNAIDLLLSGPLPENNKRRYAEMLLNRNLSDCTPEQWNRFKTEHASWKRLDWVVDGFQQDNISIGPDWERSDVQKLVTLIQSSGKEVFSNSYRARQSDNAIWLLERLAEQLPAPVAHSWVGSLIGSAWSEEDSRKREVRRWEQWLTDQSQLTLRDPEQSLW